MQDQRIADNRRQEDDLLSAFPGLEAEEDIVEENLDGSENTFYLWSTELDLFKVYKILRHYLTEGYVLDSSTLLALLKDTNLNLTKSLENIPYIHSGYVNVIAPKESN